MRLGDISRVVAGDSTFLVAEVGDGEGFLDLPGFATGGVVATEGSLNGNAARVDLFVEPDLFALGVCSVIEGAPGLLLSCFGVPTPATFWSTPSTLRVVDDALSPALFTGLAAPLPAGPGDGFITPPATAFTALQLSRPDGAFVSPADASVGGDGRLLGGYRAIEGEGPDQRSALGFHVGALGRTETGAPTAAAPFALSVRPEATGSTSLARGTLGVLSTPEGHSACGPLGEILLVGPDAAFAANLDPDLDSAPASFTPLTDPVSAAEPYGDSRVAIRRGAAALVGPRTPLAVDVADTRFAATAARGVSLVLTGGHAVAHGQGFAPALGAGARLTEPSLIDADQPGGFAIGVAPASNGVAAEISFLAPTVAGTGPRVVSLAFGDLSGRDAMVDDWASAALAAPEGRLTGAAASAGDALATGAEPFGGLATADLLGDASIFPAGVNARPEFLRWGWRNGEVSLAASTADPALADRSDRLHGGGLDWRRDFGHR